MNFYSVAILFLLVAACAGWVAFFCVLSRGSAHFNDVADKQRIIETLSWAIYCARSGLPAVPEQVEGFEAYGAAHKKFCAEVSHLSDAVQAFSFKWGLVWGENGQGAARECAEEAILIVDNIIETIDYYSAESERYNREAGERAPQIRACTIGVTVRNCLAGARESIAILGECDGAKAGFSIPDPALFTAPETNGEQTTT